MKFLMLKLLAFLSQKPDKRKHGENGHENAEPGAKRFADAADRNELLRVSLP